MSSANDGAPGGGTTRGRTARRLQRPGWRDLRLLVGLLLVVGSVAGGIRLVDALDETTPVYAAARDLLPGQAVSAADLSTVQVRLPDSLDSYVDGSAPLAPGTHLLRPVRAGELVPAAALGTSRQALDKTVSVPVDAVSAAALAQGSVVDVWVSRKDPEQTGEAFHDPELLLAGALVDSVPGDAGRFGMALGRSAVQVVVPADQVGQVIAAVDQGARITLVPAPRPDGGSTR